MSLLLRRCKPSEATQTLPVDASTPSPSPSPSPRKLTNRRRRAAAAASANDDDSHDDRDDHDDKDRDKDKEKDKDSRQVVSWDQTVEEKMALDRLMFEGKKNKESISTLVLCQTMELEQLREREKRKSMSVILGEVIAAKKEEWSAMARRSSHPQLVQSHDCSDGIYFESMLRAQYPDDKSFARDILQASRVHKDKTGCLHTPLSTCLDESHWESFGPIITRGLPPIDPSTDESRERTTTDPIMCIDFERRDRFGIEDEFARMWIVRRDHPIEWRFFSLSTLYDALCVQRNMVGVYNLGMSIEDEAILTVWIKKRRAKGVWDCPERMRLANAKARTKEADDELTKQFIQKHGGGGSGGAAAVAGAPATATTSWAMTSTRESQHREVAHDMATIAAIATTGLSAADQYCIDDLLYRDAISDSKAMMASMTTHTRAHARRLPHSRRRQDHTTGGIGAMASRAASSVMKTIHSNIITLAELQRKRPRSAAAAAATSPSAHAPVNSKRLRT